MSTEKKFPRTMKEAFGPYTDDKIQTEYEATDAELVAELIAIIFTVISLIVLGMILGGFAL